MHHWHRAGAKSRSVPTSRDSTWLIFVSSLSQAWQWQLDVNLSSAFLCCKAVLPIMEKQGAGAVTVLSSIAGVGYIGKMHIGYSTTKAALVNFAKCTAMQYARKGIR